MKTSNKLDNYFDNWDDENVSNIRTRGTYPNVKRHHCHRHRFYFETINQHKPYGMATMCYDMFDDRPDWFRFHKKRRKPLYEEIDHNDPDYDVSMHEDSCLHIPHNHVHLKPVRPVDDPNEEIGDFIEI